MRPLWEIAGGETQLPQALGAILVWQLLIAMAEELYYRGFVQSAVIMLLSLAMPAGGAPVVEVIALVAAAALFGLVHTEFVGDAESLAGVSSSTEEGATALDTADGATTDLKAEWFRVTAGYGALYGSLHVLSGHRLAAPICAHAGLNVALCIRDWQRMQRTPANELQNIFGEADNAESM